MYLVLLVSWTAQDGASFEIFPELSFELSGVGPPRVRIEFRVEPDSSEIHIDL
jgi:hypothetical protein